MVDFVSSKQANRYLSAIELLAGYNYANEYLCFVINWIYENKESNDYWDLGAMVKDGIQFPLSESWRSINNRKIDCTSRIERLLEKLAPKL